MKQKNDVPRQRGVVLLAVMVFILVTTLGVNALFQMHQTQAQRDREAQLLFVGDQYRRAIASYFNTVPPGAARSLPQSLEDLVDDHRFPTPLHHLRRLYPDPMTGRIDWELIKLGGGVSGVASRSRLEPIKRKGFGTLYSQFDGQPTYADWRFAIGP